MRRAFLAGGLLAAADHAVTLDGVSPPQTPSGGPGFERVLEALFPHGARRADRLGLAGLGFGHGEEDVGVGIAARGVVEPVGGGGEGLFEA